MNRKFQILVAIVLLILNFVLTQFNWGRIIIYPFVILSTWFHEMGHGLSALILGGTFSKIEIFPDGSGIAYITTNGFLGNLGSALISLSGPLFPPILGSIFIASAKNNNFTRLLLFFTSFILFLSTIIWVRSTFGFIFLIILSVLIFIISLSKYHILHFYTSLVIGIQAIISVYLSLGYLFSTSGEINQSSLNSDTQIIAQNLFLPNWFWASLIIVITIFLLYFSLRTLSRGPKQPRQL